VSGFASCFEDHLDLRASREQWVAVLGADGVSRSRTEAAHTRVLVTVFGQVTVTRIAYRAPGQANLHPADGLLNLPRERHSHGLRRFAVVEATRGSFDDVVDAVNRATGQQVGKRQVEALAARAAVDVDAFYKVRKPPPGADDAVLVISCDAQGRGHATRRATQGHRRRGSGGQPQARDPAVQGRETQPQTDGRSRDGLRRHPRGAHPGRHPPPTTEHERANTSPGPVTRNKWLVASVVDDATSVVAQIFAEADRRDPRRDRTWIALVDGNNHQIHRITTKARTRDVPVTIIIDFIHVLEYVWKSSVVLPNEADPAAEAWGQDNARAILDGKATRVAGAIPPPGHQSRPRARQACRRRYRAGYLTKKAPHLDYPTALANGWPIATGVIEGACRHLVKDRMDITGARWSLAGAEAILKLRAVRTNGDFEQYWDYHLSHERHRVHQSHYADNLIPCAA
jgi:hypothetical protein